MKKAGSFLLFIFLFSSIMVGQNVIQLSDGVNRLDDTLFVAQPGDIIELTTNGGVYYEYFSVLIDMPITIRAAEGLTTKPKIITDDTRAIFTVRNDLTLIGIDLGGLGGSELTGSAIRTDTMDVIDGYNLTVEDCFFHDFTSSAIKANVETIAGKVSIDNCVFNRIGIENADEGIYFKNGERAPGSVTDFEVKNSTFWNMGAEAIYVEDHDNDIATQGPLFLLENVTIHNTTDKTIYPHTFDGAILNNFIVTGDEENTSTYACRIYGTNSVITNMLTYNIGKISFKDDATVDSSLIMEKTDPMYLDMTQGNFRLAPESPAADFDGNGTMIGDPRWWPTTSAKIEIDGDFGDWAGLEPLEVTENDPNITDSVDMKAVWIAIDDEKLIVRWDFFENANFASNETSGDWNRNQGWHRTYMEATGVDGIDKYCRMRSYYGKVDTTSFSRLKWDVKSDSLGYDTDEFASTRFTGTIAWNKEGTSAEMYVLLDSLVFKDADGNIVDGITKEDSLSIYFNNNAGGEVYLPAGDGNKREKGGTYDILLSDYYVGGSSITSVKGNSTNNEIPQEYSLEQNYPNPFNPSTTINFNVPTTSFVSVKIYNMLGQEVATLVNKELTAGVHKINFNASSLTSGVYFYSLRSGDFVSTKKMMLLK